jgi:polar amino acid transport system substrate-binding protein
MGRRVRAVVWVLGWAAAANAADLPALRIGMETRLPPWSFVPDLARRQTPALSPAEMQKLNGLDVEVMKALAGRLNRSPVVVPTVWYELEKDLLADKFDVILSAWTPSPATPNTIVASRPYCPWGLVVSVRADDPRVNTPDDLGKQNLKVGHVDDPAVKRSLYALGGGRFEVRTTVVELFRDLMASRLDAVVYDSLYARWRAARQHDIRVVGEPLNRLGYHVGLRRADAALVHDVEAAVRTLGEAGELDAIRGRWEGGQ